MKTKTTQTSGAAGQGKLAVIAGLVIVNVALGLSLLSSHVPGNIAKAETVQNVRPSEYLIIPAGPVGLNQDILYVLDTQNGWLSAIGYDQASKTMSFAPRLELNKN